MGDRTLSPALMARLVTVRFSSEWVHHDAPKELLNHTSSCT